MANLPRAKTTIVETGGGQGLSTDLVAVFSCMSTGLDGKLALYTNVQDIANEFGAGEGLELAALFTKETGLGILFGKLPTATAGSIANVDVTGVTGSSAVTFSAGTVVDDAEIFVKVMTGGTIGTAGIEIAVSVDRGRTYGANIRLGTATSYLIPGTGITVAFAAGNLVAGDVAKCFTTAPRWNGAGLTAMFTALKSQARLPRAIAICGDVDGTLLDAVISEINAYETSGARYARAYVNVRDQYYPAARQGTTTVTTAQAGKTYTRAAGSWIADGFKIGMTVVFGGFVQTASNGAKTITNVTATVITVAEVIGTDEAAVANTTATATESKSAWRSAVDLVVNGATPSAAKIASRVFARMGRGRKRSAVDNISMRRRPMFWAEVIRSYQHDIHISAAKVELGGLDGWSIWDADGNLVEHDERIDGGGLSARLGCFTSVDGEAGAFCALPLSLDTDNAPLSRAPVCYVADLVATVSQRVWTKRLNGELNLTASGKPSEAECTRLEDLANAEIGAVVLAAGPEGTRISSDDAEGPTLGTTMERNVDLSTPGTNVPVETFFVPKGYLEKITNTIRVRRGGA